MGDIPDEEKLAIATHYLMSSPPGEIREVLSDVKVVLNPPTLLTDGVLKSLFRKYNTQNFEVIDGDETPVLTTEFNELDAKHYFTGNGEVFAVDHVNQKASKAAGGPTFSPGAHESLRVAVQKALEEYVATNYNEGACTVGAFEKGNEIVGVLSGYKTNLRNFWSGKWRSEWHLDFKTKKVSGKVRIVVHYFENGNVQLQQTKDINQTALDVKDSDEKGFASALKDFIAKSETDIQETLEVMYEGFSQETFRDMRRILPISKTKMDWTGAQSKLAVTMGKGKN